MSNYVRRGLLPFKEINQDQDWQMLGYFNNWQLSLIPVPNDQLVSFKTPYVNSLTTISEFKVRKLRIVGDVKTVISEIDLNTSEIDSEQDDSTTYFYRNQQTITGNILEVGCIYDIYIKDSLSNEFISSPVVAFLEIDSYLYTESGLIFELEDGQELIIEQ